jgi:hypothetical protein
VATEISENLASTAQLAVAAMLVAIALGVPLGLLAALSRNSWLDVASMGAALLGVSMPSFWLGLLLIFVFSLQLGWLPATGQGGINRLLLPAATIIVVSSIGWLPSHPRRWRRCEPRRRRARRCLRRRGGFDQRDGMFQSWSPQIRASTIVTGTIATC